MHKNEETGADVHAPESVQCAKNLVEEFFGLTLSDAEFTPNQRANRFDMATGDLFTCYLMSPTGRELGRYSFQFRPEDSWVTLRCHKGNEWEVPLQTAIDNFVNKPKGGRGHPR